MHYSDVDCDFVREVLSHYNNVGSFVAFEKVSGGFANSNFKVSTTSEQPCFLKVCNEKGREALQAQAALLATLRQHDIASKDSQPVVQVQDSLVMLYEWVDGTLPTATDMNESMLQDIGVQMAKYHLIPVTDALRHALQPGFAMGVDEMSPFLQELKQSQHVLATDPFVAVLEQGCADAVALIGNPCLDWGIVHGDIFPDNTLQTSDHSMVILDWEEGCYQPKLLDLCMTILGCCYPTDNQVNLSLVHSLMKAYTSVRSVPAQELDLFLPMLKYCALSIAFWRFRQFRYRYPNLGGRADSYREFQTRMDQVESWAAAIQSTYRQPV